MAAVVFNANTGKSEVSLLDARGMDREVAVVSVADEPGVLGHVTEQLSEAGILWIVPPASACAGSRQYSASPPMNPGVMPIMVMSSQRL